MLNPHAGGAQFSIADCLRPLPRLTIWVGRTWQTKRLGTMPALVEKCPSRLILVLMALRPGFTRYWIMLRSNSEGGVG